MALTEKLTAVADAIRGKTGKMEEMTLEQMVTEIAGISGGGDEDVVKTILELTTVNFRNDTATQICVSRLFQFNTNLKCVELPEVTKLTGNFVFSGCTALKNAQMPKLQKITGMSNFENAALEDVVFPALYQFGNNANFQNCTALRKIDIASKTVGDIAGFESNMYQNTFKGCSSLEAVIIRAEDSIWKMGNVNNFADCLIANGAGFIYVPASKIDEYRTATNWSVYADQFRTIEGSEYE